MAKREFKYMPEDFGALTVDVQHMDLHFDVFEDHTIVDAKLHVVTKKSISTLQLNAKNLEIYGVSCKQAPCSYVYKKEKDVLVLKFKHRVPKGTALTIITRTTCRPTFHILEGLYYDETPSNCPRQQITQCQQWGFQRLVPCIDDMTAKCTYSTTIIADKRYTNILTNGDVKHTRKRVSKDRDKIVYDNKITPMATYLFFLGCGTYATFTREFEYPSGKTFMLELLVPPKTPRVLATRALHVLHDAVMWIYLYTGADQYVNKELSDEIWELVVSREKAKRQKKSLGGIRKILKQKIKGKTFGYVYTGSVYREIGMQNSDFGGMENVGNTTITTNRMLPFDDMTDVSWEYMIRVKVHEFYHNLNGSEVTGRSPFEIWLNEAVTVFIERAHHAHFFGQTYSRMDTVFMLLSPHGTFAADRSAQSMPIEPDGFNDCNELITGMTYVKAPEFVRMVQTVIGKEVFAQGLALYHARYKHGNASRAQWVAAMEEVSGKSLQKMAQGWLKQTGYPTVTVHSSYDSAQRKLTVRLVQSGPKKGIWELPFVFAGVDALGVDLFEKTFWMQKQRATLVVTNVDEPAYLSLNRNYSFYGKVVDQATVQQLYLQSRTDPNVINRYLAFSRLADEQKMSLLTGARKQPTSAFVDLFYDLLVDPQLTQELGTTHLAIFEAVDNPKYAHHYQALYDVKKKIIKAVAFKYAKQLTDMYKVMAAKKYSGDYITANILALKSRQVKNSCLGILATLDTPKVRALIKRQFVGAKNASDKFVAFDLYINSGAADKERFITNYEKEAKKSLVIWEAFLAMIARCDSADALRLIKKLETSKEFRIEQANDQRALFGTFAMNRKKSLLTSAGRAYLKHILLRLAPHNEYTTVSRILPVFGALDHLEPKHQVPLVRLLREVLEALDKQKTPSVYNTIQRILKNSPKARKAVL